MKLALALTSLAFLGGMAFQEHTAEKQEPTTDWGDNPMENPEFMKAMMAAASPGAPHAAIARNVGDWVVESKITMSPGGETIVAPAEATARMVLGGRYLVQDYKSEFMGMKMEGMLILGYDNLAREYVSIWLDNMGTWPSIARGTENEKGEVVQVGQMRDIITPRGRPYRHVSWEEDGVMRTKMYDTLPDGTEWEVMDMTYRRKE